MQIHCSDNEETTAERQSDFASSARPFRNCAASGVPLQVRLIDHQVRNAFAAILAAAPGHRQIHSLVHGASDYLTVVTQHPWLSLGEECDAVAAWLQEAAGHSPIVFDVFCDPRIRKLKVPGYLVHLLAENAVKHGSPGPGGVLCIDLKAAPLRSGAVRITVLNTGRLHRPSSTGLGLRLHACLRRVFAKSSFSLSQKGDAVSARLLIQHDHTDLY